MPRPAVWMDRPPIGYSTCQSVSSAIGLPLLLAVPLLVVLLIARRTTGALAEPLPPAGLVACGSFLALWAVAARAWLAVRFDLSRGWRSPIVWLPPAVSLVACYALLLPGSSTAGAAGLIVMLVAGEATAWVLRKRERGISPQPVEIQPIARLPIDQQTVDAEAPADDWAEDVIAEIVRRREADGREAIRGWVQAELAAGQRSVPVHVAFCPALAGLPSCEAEQVAGPPATIRVAQVLPYGARFDVKLDVPASGPVTVRIEFAATAAE